MEHKVAGETAVPPMTARDWRGRSTRAIVDLDAIAANVRMLKQRAGSAALMTVVKADAYGHGADTVGRVALRNGASWLGVFLADEGAHLRQRGIEAPILVFGPFSSREAGTIVDLRLTPTVSSPEAARLLQQCAGGRQVEYHMEVDSGMTRGGVLPQDVVPLLRSLEAMPALRFRGLFTHFAGAGEPEEWSARAQLEVFLNTVQVVEASGIRVPLKHAANSAATFNFPTAHFDMVRVGISTYGYYPSDQGEPDLPLQPALTLLSEVSRVAQVPAGTGVGYGHDFVCPRTSAIALVPIGYGDGLNRRLGNGRGAALVRGQIAPIVGRISMDQLTLDVTDVPGVENGDEVVLIGRQGELAQSAQDLASQIGTISYEVLTSLLPRVPRLYVEQGRLVGMPSERQDTVAAWTGVAGGNRFR